jgi:uncharacterized membrane protein
MVSPAKRASRVASVDALRGVVMIVMALDHVRDFFHVGAMSFSPTDLSRTSIVLFLTRWVTHFCLPVFMFAAGIGAFLFGRNRMRAQLSRFLLTRGLWFSALELTVMQLAYNFNPAPRFMVPLLILWIFGTCLILMAGLVYLPFRWLAVFGLTVIILHDALDSIRASQFGAGALVWNLLHQPGIVSLAGKPVLVSYTLLPWIGVMAAGFCFGRVLELDPLKRRRILWTLGSGLTIAFFVVRAINRYGDPVRWTHQQSVAFTVLSFLNCTKYPASLDFLLMTLGPAILLLAYFDCLSWSPSHPLLVFGRVPLFYFILHFYLIHVLAALAAWLRYRASAARFIFGPLPSMGGLRQSFPPNFGYSLWVVYGVWALTVLLLYPVCVWFARVKASQRDWWLSYL